MSQDEYIQKMNKRFRDISNSDWFPFIDYQIGPKDQIKEVSSKDIRVVVDALRVYARVTSFVEDRLEAEEVYEKLTDEKIDYEEDPPNAMY